MSLYKRPDSEVWYANLKRPDGRGRIRVTTGEADRAAAQRVHNQLQIDLWRDIPATKGKTWGDAVMAWTRAAPRSQSELLSLAKFGRDNNRKRDA